MKTKKWAAMSRYRIVWGCGLVGFILADLTAPVATGDDPQAFLRYLGHGWSRGYHAQSSRRAHDHFSADQWQPSWVQMPYCRTDRYSRPNFVGPLFGCNDSAGCQLSPSGTNGLPIQNGVGNRNHWERDPQWNGQIPAAPNPGNSQQLPIPGYRNLTSPIPAAQMQGAGGSFRGNEQPVRNYNPGLPSGRIQPGQIQQPIPRLDLQPKQQSIDDLPILPPVENETGTPNNPFGVSRRTPMPLSHWMERNQYPSTARAANQIPQLNRVESARPPSLQPASLQPARSAAEAYPRSNTFNGIR